MTALADDDAPQTIAQFKEIQRYPSLIIRLDLSGLRWMHEVPPYAFESALVMQHVTLPPRLEVISDFAFRRCIALRSIDMPGSVRYIGDEAFRACSFKTIQWPAKLAHIGFWAFAYNFELEALDFRRCKHLKQICGSCFRACMNLKTVELPMTSMDRIGTNAFMDCFNLGPTVLLPAELLYAGLMFTNCMNLNVVVANHIEGAILGLGAGRPLGLPPSARLAAPRSVVARLLLEGTVPNRHPQKLLQYYWRSPAHHTKRKFPREGVTFLLWLFRTLQKIPDDVVLHVILTFFNCTDLLKLEEYASVL